MAKVVLVSALSGAASIGCYPDVNVNYNPYDPYQEDAGANTTCIGTCEARSGVLREAGNTAGSNVMPVGGATLKFNGLIDDGPTKAASLELDGCAGEMPSDSLKPGETTTLTLNSGESADVRVDSMDYDGAGLRIRVTVTPLCGMDSGVDGGGGSGGDGGAGGDGGS